MVTSRETKNSTSGESLSTTKLFTNRFTLGEIIYWLSPLDRFLDINSYPFNTSNFYIYMLNLPTFYLIFLHRLFN